MTEPLMPPQKKNPQKRSTVPTLPPAQRSRAALGLAIAAGRGQFALQHCADCGAVQYPPRDACCKCLSVALEWRETEPAGEVLAETTIRVSPDPYFRERLPWRIGTVQLAAGPVAVCHLHGDVGRGDHVRLALKLDRAGQGVMVALPREESEFMQDDPMLRAMSSDPKHRRVLITDVRSPLALPLAQAVLKAGAAQVFLGEPEHWRRWEGRAGFEAMENFSLMPLDVTDTASVSRLAAEIGGKVDILINTAQFIRPGGVLGNDTIFAREGMETNVLGLMRLAQGFGPAMASRTADGVNSAVAWVNILSAGALAPEAGFGGFDASQAAARSLSQTLRAEFAGSGLRVMNVYTGPVDDEWHQPLPPPKVTPRALARTVVSGLVDGLEEVACGDVAKDALARWLDNPALMEREMRGNGA
ncbi:MAG: short-chain dehydrogenase [Oceanibulbus sp.]|nr:short-chain dehydrogenase [Sulfitobacter sp.]